MTGVSRAVLAVAVAVGLGEAGCRDAADGLARQDTRGWATLSWHVGGRLLPMVSAEGTGAPSRLRADTVRVWGARLKKARDHGVLAVSAVRDVTTDADGDGDAGDGIPFGLEVDLKVPPPCTPEAAFAASDVLHAILDDRGAFGFHALDPDATTFAAGRLRELPGVLDVSTRSALGGLLVATLDTGADRASLLEALGPPLADRGAFAVPVPPSEAGPAGAHPDALILAIVRHAAALTDGDVERADLLPARDGVSRVVVRFHDASATRLATVTEAERGRHLVILDGRGELLTAPLVGMRISDGRFELRLGHGPGRDARHVAAVLGAGRLPAAVIFERSKLACTAPDSAPTWLDALRGGRRD